MSALDDAAKAAGAVKTWVCPAGEQPGRFCAVALGPFIDPRETEWHLRVVRDTPEEAEAALVAALRERAA